jgi:hypothetical protein
VRSALAQAIELDSIVFAGQGWSRHEPEHSSSFPMDQCSRRDIPPAEIGASEPLVLRCLIAATQPAATPANVIAAAVAPEADI